MASIDSSSNCCDSKREKTYCWKDYQKVSTSWLKGDKFGVHIPKTTFSNTENQKLHSSFPNIFQCYDASCMGRAINYLIKILAVLMQKHEQVLINMILFFSPNWYVCYYTGYYIAPFSSVFLLFFLFRKEIIVINVRTDSDNCSVCHWSGDYMARQLQSDVRCTISKKVFIF